MSQQLKALTLLILALPGLILAPGAAYMVCLCDAGPAGPAPTSCCEAMETPDSGPASEVTQENLRCCGNPQDCEGCLEIDVDDLLLATVEGPSSLLAPAVPIGWLAPKVDAPAHWRLRATSFTRPPPPDRRTPAGLLPGVRPLRI